MTRVRSPNYPAMSLPAAIEAVRKIYSKYSTHKADPAIIAKAIGYGGLNGASAAALSALKKFGLLEDVGKELKVSAFALGILVDPPGSVARAKAIVEASTMPQLFSDLQAEYGLSVPSDEILRSFMLKRGFAQSTVAGPIRTYRETMEFAAQAKALYDGSVVQEGQIGEDFPPPQSPPPPATPVAGGKRTNTANEISMRQDVFSIEEGAVTIEWPAQLSVDSLKDIEDWLTIVKRKIARSVAKTEPGNDPNEDIL